MIIMNTLRNKIKHTLKI